MGKGSFNILTGKMAGDAMAVRCAPMKIAELFSSIQGESSFAGLPCTFIRVAGCNLACSYCDTPRARGEGEEVSTEHILRLVKKAGFFLVELTGGEPLLQEASYRLMGQLLDTGYTVLLETNGSISLEKVDNRVIKIMDIKCPGSGMSDYMSFSNISRLGSDDEVKFVITDKRDFDWAVQVIGDYKLTDRCSVLISPVLPRIKLSAVAEWILHEKLPVRLQVQLHKIIWPEKSSGTECDY